MSNVWKLFQEKTDNSQTVTKKKWKFLWCLVVDINISDIFKKNPKVPHILRSIHKNVDLHVSYMLLLTSFLFLNILPNISPELSVLLVDMFLNPFFIVNVGFHVTYTALFFLWEFLTAVIFWTSYSLSMSHCFSLLYVLCNFVAHQHLTWGHYSL